MLKGVTVARPYPITEGVWLIHTTFKMYGLFSINNNCLLLKMGDNMVVINAVELDGEGFKAVDNLCEKEGLKVKFILSPGDWHHIYIASWMDRYPQAKAYVCSERVFRQNPQLAERKAGITVLERETPHIPAFANEIELLPFLGAQFREPGAFFQGPQDRTEIVVFHKQSGTLFITDHCFPTSVLSAWGVTSYSGFKPNNVGFQIKSRDQTHLTVTKILSLPIERVVFSHFRPEDGCVYQEKDLKDRLKSVYAYYSYRSQI